MIPDSPKDTVFRYQPYAKLINIPQTMPFGRPEQNSGQRHDPCEVGSVADANVPKRDNPAGFRFTMLSTVRPKPTGEDGVVADATPPCRALVPFVPTVHWSRVPDQLMSRADFVTHLIATAEHAPQTCSLRRATPSDAQSAYRASQHRTPGAGMRPRQVI